MEIAEGSSQFDSRPTPARPGTPKHKLESGSSPQSVKKNYIPEPFSQLADRFLKSSRNRCILPHMDHRAPRGTWGLLSPWKTAVGGERPCTSVSYHFPDVNQIVPE